LPRNTFSNINNNRGIGMKTFNDYYKKRLKSAKIGAKNNNLSIEDFIKTFHRMTMEEYKAAREKEYYNKACHSFWKRECENKGIKCHHCCYFFSIDEWNKMPLKERHRLGLG
jgi:hypothetical protein